MLRQFEEGFSSQGFDGLYQNSYNAKYSHEVLRSLRKSMKKSYENPQSDDFKKFDMNLKEENPEPKEIESLSRASSFNKGQLSFQVFNDDQKKQLLEDSCLGLVQQLMQKEIEAHDAAKTQKKIGHFRQKSLPQSTKKGEGFSDPKIALQGFAKINSTQAFKSPPAGGMPLQKNLASLKNKFDKQKGFEPAHVGDLKIKTTTSMKGLQGQKFSDLAERLSSRFNEYIPKVLGAHPKLISTPNLRKINLSKSPPRNQRADSPGEGGLHSGGSNDVKIQKSQTTHPEREERPHTTVRRDPITTKISLSTSPPPVKNENVGPASNHNNKSIIPNIKNLVMKFNNKQQSQNSAVRDSSADFYKKIKDRAFNRMPVNHLLLTPANDDKPSRVFVKDPNIYSNSKHKKSYEGLSRPTKESQTERSPSFTQTGTRTTRNVSHGLHSKKPIRRTITEEDDADLPFEVHLVDDKLKANPIQMMSERAPISAILGHQFLPSTSRMKTSVVRPSPEISTIKHDTSLVKGTVARPNTRGGSFVSTENPKKIITIDMPISTTRQEKRGLSDERRVQTEESEPLPKQENQKRGSLKREANRSTTQLTSTQNFKVDFPSTVQNFSKKKIEFSLDVQKLRQKSTGETAVTQTQEDNVCHTQNSDRSGVLNTEGTECYSQRDIEKYELIYLFLIIIFFVVI